MQASDMKQIIFSALAIVGMISFISCERHEWEDTEDGKGTKRLYPQEHGHDTHKEGEHAGHDNDKPAKKDENSGHGH